MWLENTANSKKFFPNKKGAKLYRAFFMGQVKDYFRPLFFQSDKNESKPLSVSGC